METIYLVCDNFSSCNTTRIIYPVLYFHISFNTEKAISQELLDLVTMAADNESDTAIEKITFLIQEGADPNYASKETGETILHKVAANWGTDLADLISEKGINIDVRDSYGRTPLHAAASSNNSDMVQWLLEFLANMEAKTTNECQTPLHYAARFDSIESINILLHAGGETQYCMNFEE